MSPELRARSRLSTARSHCLAFRRTRALAWLSGLSFLSVFGPGCRRNGDRPGERPNLVLITVDTLRADHLGSYGHSRATSPSIDRLAAAGLLFERAIAPAPWTLPSMATLHTSLPPVEHGAVAARTPLPDHLTTLAESLQAVGYDTMAFVAHVFVGRRYQLDQGFRTFDDSLARGHDAATSRELTDKTLHYLLSQGREPFFLWVHYFDPHFTYIRHPEFGFAEATSGRSPQRLSYQELRLAEPALTAGATRPFSVETAKAIYDEEIAFTDEAIGRLVIGIQGMRSLRPTVTVLTADHGEYFMERGRFGHGRDVYDELVRVPLIISGSIDETLVGARLRKSVAVASVARTIAALARVEPNPFQGEDLLAVNESEPRAPVYSFGSHAWGADDRKIMVEADGWKLIHHLDDGRYELYDVVRDPGERDDRWGERAAGANATKESLHDALRELMRRGGGEAPTLDLSPEEIERLESLGYVR